MKALILRYVMTSGVKIEDGKGDGKMFRVDPKDGAIFGASYWGNDWTADTAKARKLIERKFHNKRESLLKQLGSLHEKELAAMQVVEGFERGDESVDFSDEI